MYTTNDREMSMQMKKIVIMILIIGVIFALPFFTFVNKNASNGDIEKASIDYDEAIDALDYLFWCKGEENIDQALKQFQIDFNLSDEDMQVLAEKVGQYTREQSELRYETQSKLESLNKDEMASYAEKAAAIMDTDEDAASALHHAFAVTVSTYIEDKVYFTTWMDQFLKEDRKIRDR